MVVPSVLFFHIPVPEFDDAWKAYQEGNSDAIYLSGDKREEVCCPKINSGLFSKIKELNSSKAILVGHDHINDYVIKYQDVYLSYGIHSTNRIYYDEDLLGGRLFTIHPDHTYSFETILHHYSEVIQ